MIITHSRIFLSVAIAMSGTLNAAETNAAVAPVKLPRKEKFHLYLMMGQSNMSGRGKIEPEDQTPHPRVLMFTTNAIWQTAVEPVTRDRQPAVLGVGPGLAFGKAMAEKYPDAAIGLVPCSLGGTPLSRWQKGGDLYSNAVFRATCAMRAGTLKGVIWHQGENDSKRGMAETYGARLDQMIRDLRADLGSPDLPFVAGQLGEFLFNRKSNNVPDARLVNDTLAKLPERVPHTGCASSTGLNHRGDQLHFDAASQREFGRRYAAEMIKLQTAPPP